MLLSNLGYELVQMHVTTIEIQTEKFCSPVPELERWQEIVRDIDASTGYEFAVMAGLAAPFMGIVADRPVVINFFGGELQQRRRLLQLAMSCWIDPNELEDKLVNVSWQEGRTKLGFAYVLNADRFSVEEIKSAATYGVSRMAIVCGERPLNEEIFQDESVGGIKFWVLNLNVARLPTGDELGMSTGAVEGALLGLEHSFVGEFLLQWMRACRTRMKDIRSWIRSQARYEYENDLMTIVKNVRNAETEQDSRTYGLLPSHTPRILSLIKAITVIAIDEDVLSNIEHFGICETIYRLWHQAYMEVRKAGQDERVIT